MIVVRRALAAAVFAVLLYAVVLALEPAAPPAPALTTTPTQVEP